jgi:hypothetical protein
MRKQPTELSVGIRDVTGASPVRDGRKRAVERVISFAPGGAWGCFGRHNPAMNRWAIISHPCGMEQQNPSGAGLEIRDKAQRDDRIMAGQNPINTIDMILSCHGFASVVGALLLCIAMV